MFRRSLLLQAAALLAAGLGAPLPAQPSEIPPDRPKQKLSPLAPAPEWSKLGVYSGVLSRDEFERAIREVYGDGSSFPVPWRVEADGVRVETSPGQPPLFIPFRGGSDKPRQPARYWRTVGELPALEAGDPVLKGVRIGLDPGHIGGSWAHMEERWLSMSDGEAIMEGSLALEVARLLKPRLEELGAQVTLIRSEENPVTHARPDDFKDEARRVLHDSGISSPTESYTDSRDEARVFSVQWEAEKLFYRVSEIRARAQRVNEEIKPDLVLCLHLNAEPWGDPRHPSFVDRNHFHLLINGCYSSQELQFEDVRFEMLQRLFSQADTEELAMSGPAAAAMMRLTGLPPYIYITNNARRVSANPAVFARNLLANRLYQCPVLYFEPYVMNNGPTYRRLLAGHWIGRTLLADHLTTSPLEDYARGVVRGLVDNYSAARHAK